MRHHRKDCCAYARRVRRTCTTLVNMYFSSGQDLPTSASKRTSSSARCESALQRVSSLVPKESAHLPRDITTYHARCGSANPANLHSVGTRLEMHYMATYVPHCPISSQQSENVLLLTWYQSMPPRWLPSGAAFNASSTLAAIAPNKFFEPGLYPQGWIPCTTPTRVGSSQSPTSPVDGQTSDSIVTSIKNMGRGRLTYCAGTATYRGLVEYDTSERVSVIKQNILDKVESWLSTVCTERLVVPRLFRMCLRPVECGRCKSHLPPSPLTCPHVRRRANRW